MQRFYTLKNTADIYSFTIDWCGHQNIVSELFHIDKFYGVFFKEGSTKAKSEFLVLHKKYFLRETDFSQWQRNQINNKDNIISPLYMEYPNILRNSVFCFNSILDVVRPINGIELLYFKVSEPAIIKEYDEIIKTLWNIS